MVADGDEDEGELEYYAGDDSLDDEDHDDDDDDDDDYDGDGGDHDGDGVSTRAMMVACIRGQPHDDGLRLVSSKPELGSLFSRKVWKLPKMGISSG